jgi:hypothetical protein
VLEILATLAVMMMSSAHQLMKRIALVENARAKMNLPPPWIINDA